MCPPWLPFDAPLTIPASNQGCCFSSPRGPNSPYPGAAQSNSTRAINSAPSANQLPATAQTPATTEAPSTTRRRHRRPLDQHINKPLRRTDWASQSRTWTRACLDRERAEFFDTRVSGRPEVWQALRAALEVLWEADGRRGMAVILADEETGSSDADLDPSVALATAQSILDAADITLPTGNLSDGAYDALGDYYQLPLFVVGDPVNLAQDDDDDDAETEGKGALKEAADQDDEEVERRREEKGKAVVDVKAMVWAVIRLSDGSKDMKIRVGKEETVRSIVRRITEETSVSITLASLAWACLFANIVSSAVQIAASALSSSARY